MGALERGGTRAVRAGIHPAARLWQVESGLTVLVQPSNNRIFPNSAYEEAGGIVQEDISGASVVLAVKEVPIPLLMPERTYCFFSHTKKAQPANMPLMDALLEKKIRLVDYECITEGGVFGAKRLVAFGRFAGAFRPSRCLGALGIVLASLVFACVGSSLAQGCLIVCSQRCPRCCVCVCVHLQASRA